MMVLGVVMVRRYTQGKGTLYQILSMQWEMCQGQLELKWLMLKRD